MKQTLGPRIFGGVINEALDLGRRRGCGLCRGVQNYGDGKVCLLAWPDDAWPERRGERKLAGGGAKGDRFDSEFGAMTEQQRKKR